MTKGFAAAVSLILCLSAVSLSARAAPEWIGQTVERKGGPLAACTGPALRFSAAYQGEADGSAPAVGDVYFVRYTFVNLGNCRGNFGGTGGGATSYGFEPELGLPKRHEPLHNLPYDGTTHRVQCVLRDPMGNPVELPGDRCALKVAKNATGRWFVDTAGGSDRYRWVVPAGHSLEVTIPILAVDPVGKDEVGMKVYVRAMMSLIQEGFDFFEIVQPMQVANRPMLIEQSRMANLTATSVRLSASFVHRFLGSEGFFQLEPGPVFDSTRIEVLSDVYHDIPLYTVWANLTPDTEYRWRAGILHGDTTILGEYQTFRTPPATATRQSLAAGSPSELRAADQLSDRPTRLAEVLRLDGACSVGSSEQSSGIGIGWPLLLGAVLAALLRRQRRRALVVLASMAVLSGCSSSSDPPAGPGSATGPSPAAPGAGGTGGGNPAVDAGGGSVPVGGARSGGLVPFTFLRAPPGTFLVPDGWQVNEASLKAWQIEDHHVLTMSPPGKPDVVLGLRQFLKVMRPERAIHIASLPAKIVEVLEDKKGAGEGLYARWVARVVLDGKPAVMGMYSWATLANEQTGKRNVRLAALLTPTMAEFESFGGIDNLRRLAYAQSYHAANDPELELAGEYLGAEGTGGWSDPYTGQSTPSGFGLSLALNGKQISVLHYRQVATGVGISYTSTVARMARGTFIRDRGMIVPTWSECSLEIIANGVPGGRSACEAGWGATIHLLPRSDGSFLARMPGMEAINSVDEPGTVVVQRKQ